MIRTDTVSTNLLEKFIDFEKTHFHSFKNGTDFKIENHIDTFKMKDPNDGITYDYIRFNAVTNKSVALFKASSVKDRLEIFFNNFYREDISDIEFYRYSYTFDTFYVYICDNSLNSFENLLYLGLEPRLGYSIEIEKFTISRVVLLH